MIFVYLFVAIVYLVTFNDPSPNAEIQREIAFYMSFFIAIDIAINIFLFVKAYSEKKD